MTEKRCPACKKFKELQHFYNMVVFVLLGHPLNYVQTAVQEQGVILKNTLVNMCQRVNTIKENLNLGHQ